ncbi:TPA: hypothetical protein ACNP9N_005539, partial [Enterobacter asburiae]
PLKPSFISPMFIQTAFSFSNAVQRWVCRFSGLRLVALRWFVVFLASGPCVASANDAPRSPEEKRRSMSWAQRLKRVFSIDVTACVHCGGTVRIVASIEEPAAIRAILGHFVKQGAREEAH